VGLGFSIPINNAKRSIDEFITSGSVNDGWLGVSLIDADSETLRALGPEGKRGALVSQVFLSSPGDKAGIRPGDFITHVDKREVRGGGVYVIQVLNETPVAVIGMQRGDRITVKGNPRPTRKVPGGEPEVRNLTLVRRLRFSPMNRMSANLQFDGSQGANIRVTEHRVKFSCSFHYFTHWFRHLLM
jgi:C-terminal processing protease CtpA/Prc